MSNLKQSDIDNIKTAFDVNGEKQNEEIKSAFQKVLLDSASAGDSSYKVLSGTLTYNGAGNAPTMVVFENTFATLYPIIRLQEGVYLIEHTLDVNKVYATLQTNTTNGNEMSIQAYSDSKNGHTGHNITTRINGVSTDTILSKTAFEIRYYE